MRTRYVRRLFSASERKAESECSEFAAIPGRPGCALGQGRPAQARLSWAGLAGQVGRERPKVNPAEFSWSYESIQLRARHKLACSCTERSVVSQMIPDERSWPTFSKNQAQAASQKHNLVSSSTAPTCGKDVRTRSAAAASGKTGWLWRQPRKSREPRGGSTFSAEGAATTHASGADLAPGGCGETGGF